MWKAIILPMPPNDFLPEPWLSLLRELDRAVDGEVRLDCMRGFVVIMVYGFSRPTADLDVLASVQWRKLDSRRFIGYVIGSGDSARSIVPWADGCF